MRKPVLRVVGAAAAFAAGGVILSVGSGWWCGAFRGRTLQFDPSPVFPTEMWNRRAPVSFPRVGIPRTAGLLLDPRASVARAAGVTEIDCIVAASTGDAAATPVGSYCLSTRRLGWPFPSMADASWYRVDITLAAASTSPLGTPIPASYTNSVGESGTDGFSLRDTLGVPLGVPLPLRPLWPGLVGDSLLYGLLLWLGLVMPARARAVLRRRGGRCPACGYDLVRNLGAGCPECGWKRAAAA
jgi:hypothetical protein